MASYNGKISALQIPLVGNEEEKRWCDLANYILYTGKLCETRGEVNEKLKGFKDMVDEIHECEEEWSILESKILNGIEKYLNNKKYDFEGVDTCTGTLKYLKAVYAHGKDLEYLHHDRVDSLLKRANAVSEKLVDENCATN